jgi:hypothetical protein
MPSNRSYAQPRAKEPASKPSDPGLLTIVSSALETLFNVMTSLFKIVLAATVAVWIINHQEFLEKWLWGLTGGEVFGFKFTRETIDQDAANLEAAVKSNSLYLFDERAVKTALVRASRIAPAIVHSRILWVDDKPNEIVNAAIADFLEQTLKLIVVQVPTTAEALEAMRISPFDLLITNIWRPKDPDNRQRKLDRCRVHYFDFPDPSLTKAFMKADELQQYGAEMAKSRALVRFNEEQNTHSPAGFGMAEMLVSAPGTNSSKPEIIFFSAASAEVARPVCGYKITNRIDVLLNSIVSVLGERHADVLAKKPWEPEKPSSVEPKSPRSRR